MSKIHKQRGFTIVELLFSTAIFSVILLLCLSALVQIGRMYFKGVTTAQTQQSARAVLDELSQAMQFSGAKINRIGVPSSTLAAPPELYGPRIPISGGSVTQGAVGYFCIGTTRYTFAMDRMQGETNDVSRKMIRHAFWVDEPGVCAGVDPVELYTTAPVDLTSAGSPSTFNGRDLLSDNMRLIRMNLDPLVTDGSIWRIRITVAYGDDDLLITDPQDSNRRYCRGGNIGTQFCAFSELSTIVKRRVQ
jgi:prepilin-type N-terminal cleavage/methylation domain-containing protein